MRTMSRHGLVFRMSRHGVDVATQVDHPGGHDMKVMSRHRVATWLEAGHKRRCRETDMMSRHDTGLHEVAISK